MPKRLQNKISESRFTLPVTTALTLAMWLLGGLFEKNSYEWIMLLGVSTYLMVELNNRNALIRTYSRMVSCSFLVLTTAAAFTFNQPGTLRVQLCMILAYSVLLSGYQDKRAFGKVFYAFLFLGVASLSFIQILFFVPVLWVLMAANLMMFSPRTIPASLLGIITPYWFLAAYFILTDSLDVFVRNVAEIADFAPLCRFDGVETHQLITFCYVSALSLLGTIHFLRNSYKDKIRTRMIYEMLIAMNAATFVFIILQPQYIEPLLGLLIITAGTLTAHFLALTRTRITNIVFCLIVFSAAALTLYNIWMS